MRSLSGMIELSVTTGDSGLFCGVLLIVEPTSRLGRRPNATRSEPGRHGPRECCRIGELGLFG